MKKYVKPAMGITQIKIKKMLDSQYYYLTQS